VHGTTRPPRAESPQTVALLTRDPYRDSNDGSYHAGSNPALVLASKLGALDRGAEANQEVSATGGSGPYAV
jgi:hypothetical protein